MRLRIAAPLAAMGLLGGCNVDGGLQIDGRVMRKDGHPAVGTVVTISVDKPSPRAGFEPSVEKVDETGRFGVARIDCTCDFAVHIDARHPEFGHAHLDTMHSALDDRKVTMTLDGIAQPKGKSP